MSGASEVLIRVTGEYKRSGFCAGVIARGGRIVQAAPILVSFVRRMGFQQEDFVHLCKYYGWTVEILEST